MRAFYQLINRYPERIKVSWDLAPADKVRFYQEHGCRKGDAVIAAHADVLGASVIVSENRQFLQTLTDLPVEITIPIDALQRLISK